MDCSLCIPIYRTERPKYQVPSAGCVSCSCSSLHCYFIHHPHQLLESNSQGHNSQAEMVGFASLFVSVSYAVQLKRRENCRTQRRSRLVTLNMLQLVCLGLSNLMLTASSGYGADQGKCRLFTTFCKWSEYVQWSGWNVVLLVQMVLNDGATAWTGADGKPWRWFLFHRKAWLKGQHSYALVLDAPWLVHLPKSIPWYAAAACRSQDPYSVSVAMYSVSCLH